MLPQELREPVVKCIMAICGGMQINLAQKRASKITKSSPVAQGLSPGGIINNCPRGTSGLDQLSCGSWMFIGSMILQAVMCDVSGVGKVPYESALDCVVEIVSGGSLSVADLCRSSVLVLVGSLPAEIPVSPLKWACSPENENIFREELTKSMSKATSKADGLASNRRGSAPGHTPNEGKTEHRNMKKVIKRHSVLVNVAKKRQR